MTADRSMPSSHAILEQLAKLQKAHEQIANECRAAGAVKRVERRHRSSDKFRALRTAEGCVREIERLTYHATPSAELENVEQTHKRFMDRLFGTTELLEQILLGVSVEDLLSAQQVDKTFFSAITGSQKLLRRLGLAPDDDASFYSAFDAGKDGSEGFPGFYTRLSQTKTSSTPQLKAVFSSKDFTLPEAGSRIRSMLICQPRVFEISAWADCNHRCQDAPVTIRSASGITFGDLLDAAARLKEEHRLCPFTPHFDMDANGYAKVTVKLVTDLALKPGDETLWHYQQQKQSEADEYEKWYSADSEWEHTMLSYGSAKREGWWYLY
ncbi:hypothetical protein LTR36_009211 [Oleoguttula mirabilis]|uniref:Uncharacterized protein n=1 Tax=Oleoguttula mirabilis TaxID=1507867 RepID=A0AAV9J641_9PEZI|nr:hypothetical protein LTR36_009211 [Oleoguttula mirabilis]